MTAAEDQSALMSGEELAMSAVIAGCTSNLKKTSQPVSAASAVNDRPTMNRPMANSAEGGAAAPRMSQKVAMATGGA